MSGVCVYACVHVCMHACRRMSVQACVRAGVRACRRAGVRACVRACVRVVLVMQKLCTYHIPHLSEGDRSAQMSHLLGHQAIVEQCAFKRVLWYVLVVWIGVWVCLVRVDEIRYTCNMNVSSNAAPVCIRNCPNCSSDSCCTNKHSYVCASIESRYSYLPAQSGSQLRPDPSLKQSAPTPFDVGG